MEARVDQETCIGCGLCAGTCPAVFEINGEGKAETVCAVDDSTKSEVQQAIDECPVSAICWVE